CMSRFPEANMEDDYETEPRANMKRIFIYSLYYKCKFISVHVNVFLSMFLKFSIKSRRNFKQKIVLFVPIHIKIPKIKKYISKFEEANYWDKKFLKENFHRNTMEVNVDKMPIWHLGKENKFNSKVMPSNINLANYQQSVNSEDGEDKIYC
ncbi:hypothetical protein L9F63_028182, partial [Diploptera punctata]